MNDHHETIRALCLGTTIALLAALLPACGLGGSGTPVPEIESDFSAGAQIPGWVLTPPTSGRADVTAQSSHDGAGWTVVLKRRLETRPRDFGFALAISENGRSHSGIARIRWTAESQSGPPAPDTVYAGRVANGQITPDGVASPGEWPANGEALLDAVPHMDLPAGRWPVATAHAVSMWSAYDDEYLYFRVAWPDAGGDASVLGPLLQWDGASWQPRAHAANDVDGNGLLDAGEPMNVTSAEDEDRLSLFFPIHDESGAFLSGGAGCATSCHLNDSLDPSGAEAVHAWDGTGDLTDVWSWRAARTGTHGHLDDGTLGDAVAALGRSGGGSGLADDGGASPWLAQGTAPTTMFAGPTGAHSSLVAAALVFPVEPGYPALATVMPNAAPLAMNDFNGTGAPPNVWTGAPAWQDDFVPAFVRQAASGSRADVEAGSSFAGGWWTVEMRRRRVPRAADGSPRGDDAHFEEDADHARAWMASSFADGLPLSFSITDRARGHGVRETLYPGPIRVANDVTASGPTLVDALFVHDYGAGFAPQDATDFSDTRETHPIRTAGADVGLRLKAGTDGGEHLFMLATWSDTTPDASPDVWTWNGFTWSRSGDEDELRVLANTSIAPAHFTNGGGCAVLCHDAGTATAHFATDAINESADLWRWRAGRGAQVGFVDDTSIGFHGGAGTTTLRPDSGLAPFAPNAEPGQAFPLYMAPGDPAAPAPFITLQLPGHADAVPFVDVLAGLPPAPPTGSGTSFDAEVLPVLDARCSSCHPSNGGLDLSSHAGVLAGGNSGPAVIPGDAAGSLLVQRVTGATPPQMPLGGPPLTANEIAVIEAWINEGAQNN